MLYEVITIGKQRYHDLHPFHRLLHGGELAHGQVQAWARITSYNVCYTKLLRHPLTVIFHPSDLIFKKILNTKTKIAFSYPFALLPLNESELMSGVNRVS